MTLKELQIGKSAIVDAVGGAGALRQHFLDMGVIPGAEVTLIKYAPMGDPMELRIHGYELTLRLDDAAQITVTPTEKTPAVHAPVAEKMVEHPGLGEGGKYHTKEGEHPLPEDKTLTFALAGNQNCGKTTLFNALTGANQFVGKVPYVSGGNTPSGWDCSGFVQYVYGQMGVSLPHYSGAQATVGRAVGSLADAQPGDIIANAQHAAIYVGNGMVINSQLNGTRYDPIAWVFPSSYSIRRIF